MRIRLSASPRTAAGALCLALVAVPALAQTAEERQRRGDVTAGFPKAIVASQALSELFAERRAARTGGPLP
jgi:hypothetical protein